MGYWQLPSVNHDAVANITIESSAVLVVVAQIQSELLSVALLIGICCRNLYSNALTSIGPDLFVNASRLTYLYVRMAS